MSQHLGVASETTECSTEDIAQYMPQVMDHVQTPVLRTAPVPLYLLSRLVRERGMKVVLTGEGADELFAGYDIFREARVRRFCSRQPQSSRRPKLFQRLYPYLPGLKQQTPDYLARFFSFGAEASDEPLFSHRPRLRSTAAAKIFFSAELRDALGDYDAAADLAGQLPEDFRRWHPLHQAQYLETAFLLPGYILSSQGDRVMMANGVEGRFPFLIPVWWTLPPRSRPKRNCAVSRKNTSSNGQQPNWCPMRSSIGPSSPIARRTRRPLRMPAISTPCFLPINSKQPACSTPRPSKNLKARYVKTGDRLSRQRRLRRNIINTAHTCRHGFEFINTIAKY